MHSDLTIVCPCASHTGAIKATGGRGLQPAMDHILENGEKPVPDLSSVSSSTTTSSAAPAGQDVDDEDLEALKAVYGHKGDIEVQAAAAHADAQAEAKVCTATQTPGRSRPSAHPLTPQLTEHQMLRLRQDLQKHRSGAIPRREERARPVRRVYRGGACAVRCGFSRGNHSYCTKSQY